VNIPDDDNRQKEKAARGDAIVCEGVVVEVRNGTVVIEIANKTECEKCAGKANCQPLQGGARRIELQHDGLKVGDRVRICASPPVLLMSSAMLYLIPAALVVTGAFAGYAAGPAFLGISGDTGSMLGVAAGILVSLGFVHFFKPVPGGKTVVSLEKIE
jgi:positive regulator of sigma E activity